MNIHLLKGQIRSKQVYSISPSFWLPGAVTSLRGMPVIINFDIAQGIMIGSAAKIHTGCIMSVDTHAIPTHTIDNDPGVRAKLNAKWNDSRRLIGIGWLSAVRKRNRSAPKEHYFAASASLGRPPNADWRGLGAAFANTQRCGIHHLVATSIQENRIP